MISQIFSYGANDAFQFAPYDEPSPSACAIRCLKTAPYADAQRSLAASSRVDMRKRMIERALSRRSSAGWARYRISTSLAVSAALLRTCRQAVDSAQRVRIASESTHCHPASFARRPDKVNSHPIPYTQTDIRKMATQIDASSDAAATAAAQHTPMMQRSPRLIQQGINRKATSKPTLPNFRVGRSRPEAD